MLLTARYFLVRTCCSYVCGKIVHDAQQLLYATKIVFTTLSLASFNKQLIEVINVQQKGMVVK